MNKIKILAEKIFITNFNKKLTAILLAIIIWWFYNQDYNKEVYTVISVPIEYSGINSNFVIVSELLTNVNITLNTGPILTRRGNSDYKIVIDLSNFNIGYNKYRISVNDFVGPKENIWSIEPEEIDINIDKKIQKNLLVKLNINQGVPEDISSNITFEPLIVSLEGPNNILNNLTSILTHPIDLTQLIENKKLSVGVIIPKYSSTIDTFNINVNYNN